MRSASAVLFFVRFAAAAAAAAAAAGKMLKSYVTNTPGMVLDVDQYGSRRVPGIYHMKNEVESS